MIGMIIVIAVAVVVTAYLGPMAGQAFGSAILGGAVGAAAGSIASQGAAMAMNMQQGGINWKAVGQAGLAGGISGGLGASGLDVGGSAFGPGSWAAAATNAAAATGANLAIHGDWSWRQVVASAASAGLAGDPTTVGGLGVNWSSAAALGSRFAGNWVSNRITQGHGNPHEAWVQTVGQTVGNAISTGFGLPQKAQQLGQQTGQRWGGETQAATTNQRPQYGFDDSVQPIDYSLAPAGPVRLDAKSSRWDPVLDLDERIALEVAQTATTSGRPWNAHDDELEANLIALRQASKANQRATQVNALAAQHAYRMGEPEAMGPVWSFREVSMAQRKLDDAQALRDYQASIANGPSVRAYDPSADQARQAQRQALLNFLNGQGSMALGGVVSAGVMLGTNNVQVASAVTDSVGPLDSLLAPMGGGAALRLGRVRGSRPIDLAKTYEADVRRIYGDVPFRQRTYEAFVNGKWVDGVADNVAMLNGKRVAIEAKYVDDWAASLRNPASPEGSRPWAVAEQQRMIDQAVTYSKGFPRVIYHTNSPELVSHYSPLFKRAGVNNLEFVITPAKTKD